MLRKKTLRDIKYNKSQFFTIFLMVFLGVFVFAGVHAYMDGMQVSADNYYEKNNLQDLWLSGLNFSKDDLKQVKELDNIKDAERALTLTTTLDNYDDITIEILLNQIIFQKCMLWLEKDLIKKSLAFGLIVI